MIQGTFKTAPATAVKNRFGDYLREVLESHEPLMIERHGHGVAVLVDVKQWLQQRPLSTQSKTPWCNRLQTILKKIRKQRRPGKFTTAVKMLDRMRDEESR